jgi:signal transduction histidine kinase
MHDYFDTDTRSPIRQQLEYTRQRRRLQFLRALIFALLPFAITVGAVMSYYARGEVAADALFMLPIAGIAALIFTLDPHHNSYRTAVLLIGTITLAIALVAIPGTSLEIVYFYYFVIPVVLASTFLDIRAALITTVVVLGIIIGYVVVFEEYENSVVADGPVSFLLITVPAVIFAAYFRNQIEADNHMELQAQLDNYLNLLETAFDGYALYDGAKLISVNSGFARLAGDEADALRGTSLCDYFPADADIDARLSAARDRNVQLSRVLFKAHTGQVRTVDIVAHQMHILDHTLRFIALRDVTAQVAAETRNIEESVERETVGLFQRFIDALSHDFRTPLSVLNISIHRSKKSEHAPDDISNQLDIMHEQVQRLTHMVEDMLTMIRLDRLATMSLSWVDINHFIHTHHGQWQATAAARQQTILLDLDDTCPRIIGNEHHLLTAIDKLLENATRYSDPETTITVKTQHDDAYVCLEIHDKGMGIPAERLPTIFDRLVRADPARNSRTGGSGLGLSIVKRIVMLHDGKVDVESAPGEGSMFRVCLPRPGAATVEALGTPGQPRSGHDETV